MAARPRGDRVPARAPFAMTRVTAAPGALRPPGGQREGMSDTSTRLARLHEQYVWRVNAAVGSDMSNDDVSRLLDEYAESAVRLLIEEPAAA